MFCPTFSLHSRNVRSNLIFPQMALASYWTTCLCCLDCHYISRKPNDTVQEIGLSCRISALKIPAKKLSKIIGYISRVYPFSFLLRKCRSIRHEKFVETQPGILIDCNKLHILVCVSLSGERLCYEHPRSLHFTPSNLQFYCLLQFGSKIALESLT